MSCLDVNTVVAFAEGRLDAAGVGGVDDHVASCAGCRRLVTAALERHMHGHGDDGSKTTAAETAFVINERRGALPRGTAVGRYTMLELAGRGGMGEVYAAYDAELDRKVALKILNDRRQAGDARGQARLLREARALAKLSHPNVVAVHEAGRFAGRVFVAMEYVEGSTLKAWLAERPRQLDEILAAFSQAARGLTVAHAVGLVHRDFKPGNVMVARDGSVRVLDFGLARHVGDEPRPRETARPAIVVPADRETTALPTLTGTGDLLGTPRYMAPEQFLGAATDARTDQFSFCVALYEAVYGVPPFGDGSVREGGTHRFVAELLAGRVRPAPARSNVPAWLRRVLLRGLSVEPDARWPSMEALVAALRRDAASTRLRRVGGLGAVALVALLVISLARNATRSPDLCRGGRPRLAGAWEPPDPTHTARPRRDHIRSAILSSGAPTASEIWERVQPLLDRYATTWLKTYDEACEATHFRRAQTAALLDLRMGCLEERRTALLALTEVLAHADREVAKNAIRAADALPALDRCSDVKALEIPVEQPRDAATRLQVDALRRRSADAKALGDTGRRREGLALINRLISEAEGVGHKPLLVELLTNRVAIDGGPGFMPDTAEIAERAVWAAISTAHNDLAAENAIALIFIKGLFESNLAESSQWSKLARALLERTGGSHDLLWAWLLHNEAAVECATAPSERTIETLERSLALKEKARGAEHPDVARALNTIAEVLHRLGKDAEALRINAQALRLFTKAYGPNSPEVCIANSNRGEYLLAHGHPDEALSILSGAVACSDAQNVLDSQFGAYPLTALGLALLALEHPRPVDAVRVLERAVRAREAHEPNVLLVAEARFALAQALWEAHANQKRALALATKAHDAYASGGDRSHTRTIEAWLDDKRPPGR